MCPIRDEGWFSGSESAVGTMGALRNVQFNTEDTLSNVILRSQQVEM